MIRWLVDVWTAACTAFNYSRAGWGPASAIYHEVRHKQRGLS